MKCSQHTSKHRASALRTLIFSIVSGGLIAAGVIAAPMLAPGSAGDTTADGVAGQLDFFNNAADLIDGRGFNFGYYSNAYGDVTIDVSVTPNRVYVADHNNHRVLGWQDAAAFASHAAADIVIGQANFTATSCNRNGPANAATLCYPAGVAVDKVGNLYVSDNNNHRVLFYTQPFAAGVNANQSASGVFGQYDSFTDTACNNSGIDATTLCYPYGLALDAGDNLYVADFNNHRVLVYRTPQAITASPGSGDTTADQVLGQNGDFLSNTPNISGINALGLYHPLDVALDTAGNLYVADQHNHRVLQFNKPLSSGDVKADRVFGQPNMASNTANWEGVVGKKGLYYPYSVAVNGAGSRLFIADTYNHRVLVHTNPTRDTVADQVLGQFGKFTDAVCNNDKAGTLPPVNDKSLCYPSGLALDGPGNLHVVDSHNNRVTQYQAPVISATPATGVLGQSLLTTGNANALDERGFNGPDGVAVDRSVSPNRVYVADFRNHRVLAWSNMADFLQQAPANLVFGQPNAFVNACNQGLSAPAADTLCYPEGVAVDAAGNLFVADPGNHRVLRYDAPFANDTKADQVFGQNGGMTTSYCNWNGVTADSLCNPIGVAVDGAGNLYIGDYYNHRVLAYLAPLTDTSADKVFGQANKMGSNTCNLGGSIISRGSLCYPQGVATDATGNLYIADYYNHRVLEYNTPLVNDTLADKVFGQSNSFTTNECNKAGKLSANTLCHPYYITVDGPGNLYVSDYDNNRVLRYDMPLVEGGNTVADRVFGQGNLFNRNGVKGLSPNSLNGPGGLAIDEAANLFIADYNNHRVLQFLAP